MKEAETPKPARRERAAAPTYPPAACLRLCDSATLTSQPHCIAFLPTARFEIVVREDSETFALIEQQEVSATPVEV